METIQLSDVLKVGLVGLAGLVWLLRLEGRINFMEKRQAHLENENKEIKTKIDVIDSEVVRELSQIKETVARIEGRLEGRISNLER